MDGFRVDLPAVSRAVGGLHEVVGSIPAQPEPVDATDVFGHVGLTAGVAEFHSRWADGIAALTDDAREIAVRASRCAEDYRRVDRSLDGVFGGEHRRAVE